MYIVYLYCELWLLKNTNFTGVCKIITYFGENWMQWKTKVKNINLFKKAVD